MPLTSRRAPWKRASSRARFGFPVQPHESFVGELLQKILEVAAELIRLNVELLLERLEGFFERGLFDELMPHLLTGAIQSKIYTGGEV